jgi:hypothetical protein
MARLLFSAGARGEFIRRIQRKLTAAGFDTKGHDGNYGNNTTAAVKAYQKANGLEESGSIDEDTWTSLLNEPVPPVRDRCFALTSAFEGHGYTLAQGNFDGAGITWGIIGFTLQGGELGKMIQEAYAEQPDTVRDSFGEETDTLLAMLKKPWADQLAWADAISLGKSKATLAEPWKSAFAKFGETDIAQRLQQEHADKQYYQAAVATAKSFGIASEVGVALCFDIHVQNGGIKKDSGPKIRAQFRDGMPEKDKRIIIAQEVANTSKEQWRANVLNRKLAIANGEGDANGIKAVLRNWGLDEFVI